MYLEHILYICRMYTYVLFALDVFLTIHTIFVCVLNMYIIC